MLIQPFRTDKFFEGYWAADYTDDADYWQN
jgi:hypothetical protein